MQILVVFMIYYCKVIRNSVAFYFKLTICATFCINSFEENDLHLMMLAKKCFLWKLSSINSKNEKNAQYCLKNVFVILKPQNERCYFIYRYHFNLIRLKKHCRGVGFVHLFKLICILNKLFLKLTLIFWKTLLMS